MVSRSKRWLFIFIFSVVSIVTWLWFDFQGFNTKPAAFDQVQWMQGRDVVKKVFDPGCVLGGMALDLQKTHRLLQMPYPQLFDLIGAPDSSEVKAFLWEIGQCHGGGWNHSQLKIILDTSGRVVEVKIQKAYF